jgi:predicted lipid-binding transport protein (Tim44 family)
MAFGMQFAKFLIKTKMIITKNNPKTLFIAAIIWIAILVLIFYPKSNNKQNINSQNNTTINQNSETQEPIDTENLLKGFTEQYNSYITGDFSNIEGIYTLMTSGMKEIEMQRIENIKKETAQTAKEYITVKSSAIEYKEIKKDEELISAEIVTEKITSDGAYTPDLESEDGLIIFVDKSGNVTDKNSYESNAIKISEAFQIVAMKENGEWKIAQIQKVSE